MYHSIRCFSLAFVLVFSMGSCQKEVKNDLYVHDVEEFNKALINVVPGATIVLANGIWKDAELLFEAVGTEDSPITLEAETKGEVIFEGNSNLRIAGEYLIVKGLVFKNGFTPTNAVISFRKNRKEMANNCRLTECVIDDYNNP